MAAGALQFIAANNDFVQITRNTTLELTSGDYSFSFWLKPGTHTGGYARIINMDDGNDNSGGYSIYFTPSNAMQGVHNYGGGYYYDPIQTFTPGEWYHVVIRYSDTNNIIKVTINNSYTLTKTGVNNNLTTDSDDDLFLGKNQFYGQYLNGTLDDVAFYSAYISDEEITSLYDSGTGKRADLVRISNLIGYWDFDEGTGSVANDLSGNNYDGSITGADWVEGHVPLGNTVPNTPTNSTPANEATGVSRNPTLTASAFSDPDAGNTHAGSQWLVATDSGFTDTVWDSGDDATHLTSTTVNSTNGTFGGTRSGKTTLASNTQHYWKVRYKDNNGSWSSYS